MIRIKQDIHKYVTYLKESYNMINKWYDVIPFMLVTLIVSIFTLPMLVIGFLADVILLVFSKIIRRK